MHHNGLTNMPCSHCQNVIAGSLVHESIRVNAFDRCCGEVLPLAGRRHSYPLGYPVLR